MAKKHKHAQPARRRRSPSPAASLRKLQDLLAARKTAGQSLQRANASVARAQSKFDEADQVYQAEAARLGLPTAVETPLPLRTGAPGTEATAGFRGGSFVETTSSGTKAGPTGSETPSTVLGFSEFLSSVSEAMIAAQQRLDLQTEVYLSGSSNPRPLPTLFRLPRLKAGVKFALEKSENKKINLLFYSSGNAANSLQQHSIDFELVAVPPPPESKLAPGLYLPLMPRLELVQEQAQRQLWLAPALDDPKTATALGLPAGADPAQFPSLLCWQFIRPAKEIPQQVLLAGLASDSPPKPRLVLLQFTRLNDIPEPRFDGSQPLDLGALSAWLGEFLQEAGARQLKMLTGK